MKSRLLLAVLIAVAAPLMAGTQYTVIGNATSNGARGAGGPLVRSGSFLFGASRYGGSNGFGSIFSFNPATGNYTLHHSFTGAAGGFDPLSGVVKATDNKLYGVAFGGGANSQGTLFRIDLNGANFQTQRSFAAASGGAPESTPIQAADGKLYGVTGTGGNGFGGIYRVDLDGTNYSLIHTFNGTAMSPFGKGAGCGGVVEGPDPTMLYGCTRTGGNPNDTGVFFVATKNGGGGYNFMHSFDAPGLNKPCNRLLLASDGYFYGAADEGGAANKGGIFRMTTSGVEFTVLHEFSNDLDGFGVYSPLVEGSDGYLYGCASSSSNNMGSVFRMSKDGKSFVTLHRSTASPAAPPTAPSRCLRSSKTKGFPACSTARHSRRAPPTTAPSSKSRPPSRHRS